MREMDAYHSMPQAAITALGLAILPLIQLTPAVSASSLNSGHRSVGTLTAKLRIRSVAACY